MAAANIKACYVNIMENGTVSLGTGTAESSYPLSRLSDRLIGRIFKSTAAETITVKLDQGASGNLAADRLLIEAGHNLNLATTIDIEHSPDDSVWTAAVAQWTQGDALIIDKSWTSITRRYWRLIITTPSSAVEIPELFLTQTYSFEKDPIQSVEGLESQFNVLNDQTVNGGDRFIVMGASKKKRNYRIELARSTQTTNIQTLNDAWAGAKPFYMNDHNQVWIWGKLNSPLELATRTSTTNSFDFDFQEVIS